MLWFLATAAALATAETEAVTTVKLYHSLILSGQIIKAQAMVADEAKVKITRANGVTSANAAMLAEFLKGCSAKDIVALEPDEFNASLGDRVFVSWHCPVSPEKDTYVSSLGVKDGKITIDLTLYAPPVVMPAPATK